MIVSEKKQYSCEEVVKVARYYEKVSLSHSAVERIKESKDYIAELMRKNISVYGVNTGFGDLASVSIDKADLRTLQTNIVRSHAVGVGKILDEEVARAMLFLRVLSLSKGNSGIALSTLELMIKMLNSKITPCVPEKGSVGASGDLVPLAHLALSLIGEGEVIYKGKVVPTMRAFKMEGLKPVRLEAKEGLALLNGTQLIAGIGALAVYDALLLAKYSDIAAALSGDVMDGTDAHLNPLVHNVRPHQGQKNTAENIRNLLRGSGILGTRTKRTKKIQDAYSLRGVPQVHGAVKDATNYCHGVFSVEVNAVTDNPLIFPQEDQVISAGNFHGQPVALAADFLGIAMAGLCGISERRIARLVDKSLSNTLPPFLIKDGGLNSGLMIPQYTAAALASENKVLAHPSSVDSITTSANQEDYVSMGGYAARKCREIINNTRNVLAIEFLCNTQALELRRPLETSNALETVLSKIRKHGVPFIAKDTYMKPYMDGIYALLENDILLKAVESKLSAKELNC